MRDSCFSTDTKDLKFLVVLDGLDTTISAFRRKSSTLHANALLMSLLRNLEHLVDTFPQVLVLVSTTTVTNTYKQTSSATAQSAFSASSVVGLTALSTVIPTSSTRIAQTARSAPVQSPLEPDRQQQFSTTARILEDGVQKWVLVHEGTGQRGVKIVEVVKDDTFGWETGDEATGQQRAGWGLGHWATLEK